jgi:transforming growth factor-beta-induced protein
MKFMTKKLLMSGAAIFAMAGIATAQDNPMVGGAAMFADRNIVENAVNSADHTTLVAAVKAAGLVETLQGEGPFTVFAPTNAAFDKLPDGTVETLLMEKNRDQLADILKCHVVGAEAMSGAIVGMVDDDGGAHPVPTLGSCTLTATYEGDTIMLEDENGTMATVTIADVKQSNGVIHVIDAVMTPAASAEGMQGSMESDGMGSDDMGSDDMAMADGDNPMVGGAPMLAERNIIENAVNSADHTTLVAAVKAAGLVETLQGEGPFTVFAPTNAAFDKLPDGTVETLLMDENKDQLTKVLTAHVVAGDLSGAELMERTRANGGRYNMQTVSGDAITADLAGGKLYIIDESGDAAQVTIADVDQSNGVIHVVDSVLVPR